MYILYRIFRHLSLNFFHFIQIILIYQLLLTFVFGKINIYLASSLEASSHTKTVENRDLAPIILVPGDGGCQLEAKWLKNSTVHFFCTKKQVKWTTLWLVVSELAPYIVNCFVDNMKLIYNNKTRSTENSPGVNVRVSGFGDTESVEYLDPSYLTHYFLGYFDTIVKRLITMGYVRNKSIRGAPFDFRKAPNELEDYYLKLTQLIEESYKYQNNRKAIVIAHSMGAPVLHYFFLKKSQQWKDKYIEAVISLSGAWGGSVKPIKVYAVGDDLGYRMISASKIKPLQISFASLAFLMPSRDVWGMSEVLVQTPNKNYSLSNIEEYFNDLPFRNGYEMYKDTKDLLYKAPPPGVEVHCLHGVGVPTTERITFKNTKDFPSNPTLITGDGDGTVNSRSASLCLKWQGKQKQKIYYKTYNKVDHMKILSNSATLDYIASYVKKINPNLKLKESYGNESKAEYGFGCGEGSLIDTDEVESNRIFLN